jgi:hypothetical protein
MPNFLVLGIYLLLLSDDGEGEWWNRFLHYSSVKNKGDNYDISNFTGMTTWRPFFPDSNIKAEMMLLP